MIGGLLIPREEKGEIRGGLKKTTLELKSREGRKGSSYDDEFFTKQQGLKHLLGQVSNHC